MNVGVCESVDVNACVRTYFTAGVSVVSDAGFTVDISSNPIACLSINVSVTDDAYSGAHWSDKMSNTVSAGAIKRTSLSTGVNVGASMSDGARAAVRARTSIGVSGGLSSDVSVTVNLNMNMNVHRVLLLP